MTAPGGRTIGQVFIDVLPEVKDFAKALRRELHATQSSIKQFDRDIDPVQKSMAFLAKTATGITPGIQLAALSFRALAAQAIVGNLYALGGALFSVGRAAATLPAIMAAGASATTALKIGLFGVQDALKKFADGPEKFAKEVEKLSQNAQSALYVLEEMRPRIEGLRESVQDSLFAGVDDEIRQLGGVLLPIAQKHFVNLTTLINQSGRELSDFVQSAATLRDIGTFTKNVEASFDRLQGGVKPVAGAIRDIVTVGSGQLPVLSDLVTDLATDFAAFIAQARATGQLQSFMSGGVEAIRQLVRIVVDLGVTFYNVFSTAEAAGAGLLDSLELGAQKLREFFESAEGQRQLINFLLEAKAATQTLIPIVTALADVFFNHLLPVLVDVAQILGPSVEQFIRALGEAIDIAAPGVRAFAEGFGNFITAIIPALPALAQLIGAIGQLVGVLATRLGPIIADVTISIAQLLIPVVETLTSVFSVIPGPFLKFVVVLGVVIATVTGVILVLKNLIAFGTLFASSIGIAATATLGLTRAMQGLQAFVKTPLGLAIIGVTALLGTLAFQSDDTAQKQEELATAAKDLNAAIREQNGVIDNNIRLKAAQQLDEQGLLQIGEKYGISTRDTTRAYLEQGEALKNVIDQARQLRAERVKEVEDQGNDVQFDPQIILLDQYISGLQKLSTERDRDTAAANRQRDAAIQQAGPQQLVVNILEAQLAVTDLLRQASEAEEQQRLASVNANLAWHRALSQANTELSTGIRTLDIHTAEGQANIQTLVGVVEAGNRRVEQLRTENASTKTINDTIAANREALISLLLPFAKDREAAIKLAQSLGLVKAESPVKIDIKAEALKTANTLTQQLIDRIRNIPTSRTVDVRVNVSGNTQAAKGIPTGGFPRAARGGKFNKNDYSIVGEEGPELVAFGEAARVFSHGESKGILRNTNDLRHFTGPGVAATQRTAPTTSPPTTVNVSTNPEVKVYIDGQELRNVAVQVVNERDRQLTRIMKTGARSRA